MIPRHWVEAVAWLVSWPLRRALAELDDWTLHDWAGAVAGDEDD